MWVWNGLGWYIKGLLLEQGEPSLTKFLALASYLVFVIVTFYLILMSKEWSQYSVFASITGGGGLLAQVANKINNSINKPTLPG